MRYTRNLQMCLLNGRDGETDRERDRDKEIERERERERQRNRECIRWLLISHQQLYDSFLEMSNRYEAFMGT